MPLHYLIGKLVRDPQRAESLRHVCTDPDPECQAEIRRVLADISQDNTDILTEGGPDWILCVLSRHGSPDHETFRVFQALSRFLYRPDTFDGILEATNRHLRPLDEVADRCLFALSLYPEYLRSQTDRHAAPSPEFYRRTGQKAFEVTGFPDVAEHWASWEDFLGTEFALLDPTNT